MPPTYGAGHFYSSSIALRQTSKSMEFHGVSWVVLSARMHYSVLMTETCCWNMKHNQPTHNNDCLAHYGPQYRDASMAVTFTDGKTILYKNVRVCINRPHNDGIVIEGTTIRFEAGDVCFTLVGVRQFAYEIEDDL